MNYKPQKKETKSENLQQVAFPSETLSSPKKGEQTQGVALPSKSLSSPKKDEQTQGDASNKPSTQPGCGTQSQALPSTLPMLEEIKDHLVVIKHSLNSPQPCQIPASQQNSPQSAAPAIDINALFALIAASLNTSSNINQKPQCSAAQLSQLQTSIKPLSELISIFWLMHKQYKLYTECSAEYGKVAAYHTSLKAKADICPTNEPDCTLLTQNTREFAKQLKAMTKSCTLFSTFQINFKNAFDNIKREESEVIRKLRSDVLLASTCNTGVCFEESQEIAGMCGILKYIVDGESALDSI